jgi:hypothetical protein
LRHCEAGPNRASTSTKASPEARTADFRFVGAAPEGGRGAAAEGGRGAARKAKVRGGNELAESEEKRTSSWRRTWSEEERTSAETIGEILKGTSERFL